MISAFVIAETKEIGHKAHSVLSAHGIIPLVVTMKPGPWLARAACKSFPAARQALGSLVRESRHERTLTLKKLSELVDMDDTYLSLIESGAVPLPSPKKFRKILVALDISEEELIRVSFAPFIVSQA